MVSRHTHRCRLKKPRDLPMARARIDFIGSASDSRHSGSGQAEHMSTATVGFSRLEWIKDAVPTKKQAFGLNFGVAQCNGRDA